MCPNHLARRSHQLAGRIGQRFVLLGKISVDELFVISAGNKTNFLRVWLLRKRQSLLLRQLAHFGLAHSAQRKQRSAQLLLRKTEQEVRLILRGINRTLQQPAPTNSILFDSRVMSSCQHFGADLSRSNQQLIELKVIVAETARNRCSSRKVFLHKWTNYVVLETLLLVHYVIRNLQLLGDAARIVNVVDRTTASLHGFGHSFVSSQPPLIPQLHRQAHNVVAFGTQHRRNGRRIHSARHRYRNCLLTQDFIQSLLLRVCTPD